jgi:hypothetical protein
VERCYRKGDGRRCRPSDRLVDDDGWAIETSHDDVLTVDVSADRIFPRVCPKPTLGDAVRD